MVFVSSDCVIYHPFETHPWYMFRPLCLLIRSTQYLPKIYIILNYPKKIEQNKELTILNSALTLRNRFLFTYPSLWRINHFYSVLTLLYWTPNASSRSRNITFFGFNHFNHFSLRHNPRHNPPSHTLWIGSFFPNIEFGCSIWCEKQTKTTDFLNFPLPNTQIYSIPSQCQQYH